MTGVYKIIRTLIDNGQPVIAKKILSAIKTGKPVKFTKKEENVFTVFRAHLTGSKVFKNPITKLSDDFAIKREMGVNRDMYGQQHYGRSIYGQQKNVPITDIDFKDPFSHAKDQVVFDTLTDFVPALKSYMKTPRGKQSAFKIYRTPAGLRLFDVSKLSKKEPVGYYGEVWDAIGADPRFVNMANITGKYATRLHPKVGRKHNIWHLKGNVRTGEFSKKNPGDFVAKQKIPGSIIKGPDAIVDPQSLKEVQSYHDMIIRQILMNKNKTGITSMSGLFDMLPKTFKL